MFLGISTGILEREAGYLMGKNCDGRKGCGGCTQPWVCRHVEVVEIGKGLKLAFGKWRLIFFGYLYHR